MRLCRAVALGVGALIAASCGDTGTTRSTHRDEKTFSSSPGKLVVLDLRSLDAEIEVVPEGDISVEVDLRAHSSSRAAARRWIERNTPTFDDSAARLEVTVPKRGSVSVIGFINTSGGVRVRVPAECRLEVKTGSGDVDLLGGTRLAGPVRVDTGSGDIAVHGGAGEVLVDTSSGNLTITGPALSVLEADTASGDVRLEAGADRAVIETSSGDVVLRDLRGDLSVVAASGDVDARWTRCAAGNKIRVETTSGDVVLRIAAAAPVAGDARTSSGRIESEFDGAEDRRGRRLTFAPSGGAAEASSGGAIDLSVRTTSGNVTLIRNNPEV